VPTSPIDPCFVQLAQRVRLGRNRVRDPLERKSPWTGREAQYCAYPHYGNHGNGPCSSVRVGDWKLLEWLENDSVELFNLAADLSEKRDVAAENPQLVKELQLRLKSWRQETKANMPRPMS
jgi:hypothetical protein